MACIKISAVNKTAPHLNIRAVHICGVSEGDKGTPAEFSFRASGGKSIKDGAARIKRLKGNSVVWNQHYPTGWNWSQRGVVNNSANGVITSVGVMETTFFNIQPFASNIANHRYLFIVEGLSSTFSGNFGLLNRNAATKVVNGFAAIFHTNSDTSLGRSMGFEGVTAGTEINETYTIVQYDLTQMFEAGNEPTTIEEFYARKPIVEDEYAYNEGEVIHMTAEGIKSVGDNAWDEEWEVGGIDYNSGVDVAVTSKCRNRGFVKVLPNEEYYLSVPSISVLSSVVVICYDENKQFVNHIGGGSANARFTIPSDCNYIRFTWVGTTYNNDIMISLVHSGWKQDIDAKYQPYWEDRLIFDQRIKDEFPNGMSKWDMVYNKDGKGYIVKGTIGIKMTDFSIRKSQDGVFIVSGLQEPPAVDSNGYSIDVIVASYSPSLSAYGNLTDTDSICIAESKIWLSGSSLTQYSTAEEFSASLGDTMVWYKSAEPTIIEYDEPFNLDYRVADFGTEQAIAEQPSAPISADIAYVLNL